mgnify:CR=1 FL=1
MDWTAARDEYIQGGITYRQLAAKYKVPLRTLGKRAKAEDWVGLRQQVIDKSATLAADATAQAKADMATRIYDSAGLMLDKVLDALQDAVTPKDIRALTAAVKDIREIVGIKSAGDQAEQEARIAKLRRDAAQDGEKENTAQLVISGLPEGFEV